MFDAPCRVESIIWIPGACVDIETLPEEFAGEFVENLPGKLDAQLYTRFPQLKRYADSDDYPEPEEVADALSQTTGFLVKAATPVKTYLGESVCEYSWGGYYTGWLYAENEAEIGEVVLAWAAERDAACKAKFLAAA
jgi:hypothetical protein